MGVSVKCANPWRTKRSDFAAVCVDCGSRASRKASNNNNLQYFILATKKNVVLCRFYMFCPNLDFAQRKDFFSGTANQQIKFRKILKVVSSSVDVYWLRFYLNFVSILRWVERVENWIMISHLIHLTHQPAITVT